MGDTCFITYVTYICNNCGYEENIPEKDEPKGYPHGDCVECPRCNEVGTFNKF